MHIPQRLEFRHRVSASYYTYSHSQAKATKDSPLFLLGLGQVFPFGHTGHTRYGTHVLWPSPRSIRGDFVFTPSIYNNRKSRAVMCWVFRVYAVFYDLSHDFFLYQALVVSGFTEATNAYFISFLAVYSGKQSCWLDSNGEFLDRSLVNRMSDGTVPQAY